MFFIRAQVGTIGWFSKDWNMETEIELKAKSRIGAETEPRIGSSMRFESING